MRPRPDPSVPAESIRSAQRSLALLTALAVLGTAIAALMGIVSSNWTLSALRQADVAAGALRQHIQADMLHDMLRADLFARAMDASDAEEEFHEHARDMEDRLRLLEGMPLPREMRATLAAQRDRLHDYAQAGRALMEQPGRPTIEQLEAFSTRWRELEAPLRTTADALRALVTAAEENGRRGRVRTLVWTGGALLLLIALVLLASQRLSRSVLEANRQLAVATEQALQASQSRTEFLASMSHEIRTPMTGVLGIVDLLASENLAPAQRRAYVEALRSSGQHLLAVINDILDFTRIESGRLELENLEFSPADVLEQLRSLVHPLAVERGLAFSIEQPQPPLPMLRGDPTRLRQVLLNLSSNGVKFTERGSVQVSVRGQQQQPGRWRVRFEVRDTGVGIPPEAMAELFTPFHQADRSITRRYGGSGLGLAICKRLVEAMGGEIGLESTPGAGSVFFFELELAEGDPGRLAGGVEAAPTATRPKRILVAEDVEINRHILQKGLERAGHQPVFAHDGAEAVALAERERFDLILMDVQMPGMDGIEATRRIRQLANGNSWVPILALTANVMAQERERYLAAGMDACLTKPIDWDRLFAAIDQHDRAAGSAEPAAAEPALVDEATHATLVGMASREHLAEWLQVGMASYEAGWATMADAEAARVATEAHKMKGSAGTLGLPRLHALAAQIEQSARAGAVSPADFTRLGDVLAQTRAALRERGLL